MASIRLGNGKHVRVGDYVAGIKKAKANPDATFTHGLGGWFPETGVEIAAAARRHLTETVINRKAGLVFPDVDPTARLAKRIKAGKLTRSCKWCGSPFTPATVADHFDDASCREAYYS